MLNQLERCVVGGLLLICAAGCTTFPETDPDRSKTVGRITAALGGCSESLPDPATTPPATPHVLSGVWLLPGSQTTNPDCRWRPKIVDAYHLGVDTIVYAGQSIERHDGPPNEPTFSPSDPFSNCKDPAGSNQSCWQAAKNNLALNPNGGSNILEVFTLDTYEDHLSSALQVNFLDKRIESGDEIFWRILVPAADVDARGLDARSDYVWNDYYLFLIRGEKHDAMEQLLSDATSLGMKVFGPNPDGIVHPTLSWAVDNSQMEVMKEFTRRIMVSHNYKYASNYPNAYAGIYSGKEVGIEMASGGTYQFGNQSILQYYDEQHTLVKAKFTYINPKVMISPYWTSFIPPLPHSEPDKAQRVYDAMTELSKPQYDVDIIAPQVGNGDATVGLFYDYAVGSPMSEEAKRYQCYRDTAGFSLTDPYYQSWLAQDNDCLNAAPSAWSTAYESNVFRMFEASRAAVDNASRPVELWANIEAFTPRYPKFYKDAQRCSGSPIPICGVFKESGTCGDVPTIIDPNKPRQDKTITHVSKFPSKLIAWQFDSLWRCNATTGSWLSSEMANDLYRPIPVYAYLGTSGGVKGVFVFGYNLDGNHVKMSYNSTWVCNSGNNPLPFSWVGDPSGGDRWPEKLRVGFAPCDYTSVPDGVWVGVNVKDLSRGIQGNEYYRFIK